MLKKFIAPGIVIALLTFATAIVNLWEKQTINIEGSTLENSPVVSGSPNTTINIESKKVMVVPIPNQMIANTQRFFVDGQLVEKLFNMKYQLPNNNLAYASEVTLDDAIIAHYNSDCSEVEVTEKYSNEISDEEICWLNTISCSTKGDLIDGGTVRGPKFFKEPASCFVKRSAQVE